jgi:hypothetical protein
MMKFNKKKNYNLRNFKKYNKIKLVVINIKH